MPAPNIKDVTEAVCPEDKPHKCLPYGTCYGHDSYCNQQHGDVVSCFPLELRNDITRILDWCRDVKQGIESHINSACKFACEHRFNSSELEITTETQPELSTTNCSSIVREVTSCPLPKMGGNQTNIFDWCNGVLQQSNFSACDTNNQSVFVTDTPSDGISSAELPTWCIAVTVILALLFMASLILNVYFFCKERFAKPCDRGSYSLEGAEKGKIKDEGQEGNETREEAPVHRQGERIVNQENAKTPRTRAPGTAGARQKTNNVAWAETDEAIPNPMGTVQFRNSTSEAVDDHQGETTDGDVNSEAEGDTETDPFMPGQEEGEQQEDLVHE